MALSNAQILEILQNRKTPKGTAKTRLSEFLESDEVGVDVMEQWPIDFGKGKAGSLYQSFRTAAKELGVETQVDVVNRDGHLFLLNKALVETIEVEA